MLFKQYLVLFKIMADLVHQLPVDSSIPNNEEINIINSLFQQNSKGITSIISEMKSAIIAGILFILFSFPQIDNMFNSIFNVTKTSPILLVCIKAFLFTILLYFILNFSDSRIK